MELPLPDDGPDDDDAAAANEITFFEDDNCHEPKEAPRKRLNFDADDSLANKRIKVAPAKPQITIKKIPLSGLKLTRISPSEAKKFIRAAAASTSQKKDHTTTTPPPPPAAALETVSNESMAFAASPMAAKIGAIVPVTAPGIVVEKEFKPAEISIMATVTSESTIAAFPKPADISTIACVNMPSSKVAPETVTSKPAAECSKPAEISTSTYVQTPIKVAPETVTSKPAAECPKTPTNAQGSKLQTDSKTPSASHSLWPSLAAFNGMSFASFTPQQCVIHNNYYFGPGPGHSEAK
jgi:hypothetical protein